ncbi:serine/threonine-protein kinase [Thermomonospora umbrina]|uniref:serine/threonine-protein kinase n=1 Tax=Thermomonospora umbrina TaxID=111806 RepID=UPI001476C962|nr:serine/threonine-protein kinase [Thermomonospora umbrina]
MNEWRIADFREVRELGRGAQGRVVLAVHEQSGTPVAIKYLAAGAEVEDRARFAQEARMLAQVQSPHVARLYRLVESEQGTAIIMEAVNGASLKEVLAQHGALQPEAALAVLKGSLLGLAAAHAVGVVHRDYKPANVVVPADGYSRLIDFGIAVMAGTASRSGTPSYMAPEQWENEPATPATDVYAATCVFFEAVTGRRPYAGTDQIAMMNGHLLQPVPVDSVPEPLRPLVARGMAKRAEHRPFGAAAFVDELEQTARAAYGADWEDRGVRTLAAGAVALAALFPLTAAGLAPLVGAGAGAAGAGGAASAVGGAAAGKGVLASAGAKITIAALGTAAAVTTGAVAVNALDSDETVRARPTPTVLAGVPYDFGAFTLRIPRGWQVTPLQGGTRNGQPVQDSYRVNVPGRCTGDSENNRYDKYVYTTFCPGFAVLGPSRVEPENGPGGVSPNAYYHAAGDISHICPPDPERYPSARGVTRTRTATLPWGNRRALYGEWRMRCASIRGGDVIDVNVYFTQRLWFLPQSQIAIVDEWGVPGLDKVLAAAVWRR